MKTLSSFYPGPVPSGDVALEVEVEFKYNPATHKVFNSIDPNVNTAVPDKQPGGVWLSKRDGSLMCGVEYVMRNPVKCNKAKREKIKVLTDFLFNTPNKRWTVDTQSTNAGIHCHVNAGNLTPLQIWTATVLYWLVEDPIMKFCGSSRMSNQYCHRNREAQNTCFDALYDIKNNAVPFKNFNYETQNHKRYSSLNLVAATKYRSLEFRGMGAKYDLDVLDGWSSALHELVHNYAARFKDPADVMDRYIDCSKDDFLDYALPPFLVNAIRQTQGYAADINTDVVPIGLVAYANDDWSEWAAKKDAYNTDNPPIPMQSNAHPIEEDYDTLED
jgi:hypothetical protein